MSTLDLDTLLSEVSAEAPGGENLEYDAEYTETLRLSEGTPEQQIGDTIIEASEPDWREVRKRAIELARRTRDLRLGVLITLASLRTHGLPGLRDGLVYVAGLLERHWEHMYPLLDPDDGNDPTERVMILTPLANPPGTFGDTMRFQDRLRESPLTNSRRLGQFSYADILRSTGDLPVAPDHSTPDPGVINGAFEDTPIEELQATAQALQEAIDSAKAIDRLLTERAGSANAADLSSFVRALHEVAKTVAAQLERRGYGQEGVGMEASADGEPAGGGGGGGGGAQLSGEIRSPQDVLLAFDKVCRYYERCEPSSPVPILVRRAQRLVSKPFLEIIRDLTPDALGQIQFIGGIEEGTE